MHGTAATLRYLDATAVLSPAGELRDFKVSDTGGLSLGELAGFVIDPAARQLRYFVVEVARWLSTRRYLIPLCPATLEPQHRTVTARMRSPRQDSSGVNSTTASSPVFPTTICSPRSSAMARRSGRQPDSTS